MGMRELKPCAVCGGTPTLGHVCGEYFVHGEDEDCPCCGVDFSETHSSEELEIEVWNRRTEQWLIG